MDDVKIFDSANDVPRAAVGSISIFVDASDGGLKSKNPDGGVVVIKAAVL